MSGKRFSQFYRGERVDRKDFTQVAELTPRDAVGQIGHAFLVGELPAGVSNDTRFSNPQHYVISGFEVSEVSGGVQVSGGTAIMSFRDRGEIGYGQVSTEGSSKLIDISTLTDDVTYGIYVRMTFAEHAPENRAFWNELGSPDPTEYIRHLPTLRVEDFEIAVEQASPGAEWMQIAAFTPRDPDPDELVDRRIFYFEGQAVGDWETVNAEWGLATPDPDDLDRSDDRDEWGVFGLRRFVRAIQKQIANLIGGENHDKWWTFVEMGVDQLFARDGSRTMSGDIVPTTHDTYDLGSNTVFWQQAFIKSTVSEAFVYETTAARWRTMAAVVGTHITGAAISSLTGTAQVKTSTVTGAAVVWNVDVPEGAILTHLEVSGDFDTSGWTTVVVRKHYTTGTEEDLFLAGPQAISSGTGVAGPFVIDQFETVDNRTYSYQIQVIAGAADTGSIYSVGIRFTVDNIQP